MDVIDPPGELMYIVMSRSGSMASRVSSWAITSLAEASSIWTPRKIIRSSKSLLYGFISLIPYEVRSTKDGSTYLDCGASRADCGLRKRDSVTFGSLCSGPVDQGSLINAQPRHDTSTSLGTSTALRITWSTKP